MAYRLEEALRQQKILRLEKDLEHWIHQKERIRNHHLPYNAQRKLLLYYEREIEKIEYSLKKIKA